MELRQQVSRALNRPCNQLRKERNEQGVNKEIPLYSNLALIYINGIAQCLKNTGASDTKSGKNKAKGENAGTQQQALLHSKGK